MLLRPAQPAETDDRTRNGLISAALHAAIILAGISILHHAPTLATYKLPGTHQGTLMLTYYSPGSPQHATSEIAVKTAPKTRPTPAVSKAIAAPAPVLAQAPPAQIGTGTSAQSGLGDGDISIALQKFFPHPAPDLSGLPRGTRGDVVLNAVIDEQGKIADLTLIKGLGPAIDDAVIATVKHWTYAPATKNGSPVRSEQELHFHYERS